VKLSHRFIAMFAIVMIAITNSANAQNNRTYVGHYGWENQSAIVGGFHETSICTALQFQLDTTIYGSSGDEETYSLYFKMVEVNFCDQKSRVVLEGRGDAMTGKIDKKGAEINALMELRDQNGNDHLLHVGVILEPSQQYQNDCRSKGVYRGETWGSLSRYTSTTEDALVTGFIGVDTGKNLLIWSSWGTFTYGEGGGISRYK
jgi:hypothetical protein